MSLLWYNLYQSPRPFLHQPGLFTSRELAALGPPRACISLLTNYCMQFQATWLLQSLAVGKALKSRILADSGGTLPRPLRVTGSWE